MRFLRLVPIGSFSPPTGRSRTWITLQIGSTQRVSANPTDLRSGGSTPSSFSSSTSWRNRCNRRRSASHRTPPKDVSPKSKSTFQEESRVGNHNRRSRGTGNGQSWPPALALGCDDGHIGVLRWLRHL